MKSFSYFFNDFLDDNQIVEIYENQKEYEIKIWEFWGYILDFVLMTLIGIVFQYKTNDEQEEEGEDDQDYVNMEVGMVEINLIQEKSEELQ